ncbi:glycosyltransferase family 4 protein [Bifidobacterium simiiventris]|uniref:glycosyltransferase family 4 protein n=1 Tax=Bifidobacterium simiiventris TaxID=2834434 RepID=UPI001C5630F7|nr:glycosyltransferase family 4 protein [Bifidobacterium simiiventris]MBW3078681.1 glycosyltransferase family 4 protein [Bifidobacterium simiiventris]
MRNYHILQVHNYYQIPGGEDTVVKNERDMLEKHGHVVIQYTRNNGELKSAGVLGKAFAAFTTIFNPRTYHDVRHIIRAEKIDIVHVHNTLNLISPAVYYAAISCNVPVVQTIHNFRMLCPSGTFFRDDHICEDCVTYGLRSAVQHNCYRDSKLQTFICALSMMLHRATGIYDKLHFICLTDFNKQKLLQLPQIDPTKVYIKPNFITTIGSFSNASYIQRKNRFVFAGRLDKLKGIRLLLSAWAKMGALAPELIICGTGPEEQWAQDFISEHELTMVTMRGFVPNSDVRKILADSKALILPSQWYEGFPMSIVEAYGAGTPVIGSKLGNVGDLIADDVTGWKFKYDDVDDLINAVRRAESAKSVDLKSVREKYSEMSNYQDLMRIYDRITT